MCAFCPPCKSTVHSPLQTAFLKHVVGAKLPTLSLLYTELSQTPMQVHWAKLVAKFWNRLAMSKGSTLGKRVLRDILQRAQSAGFQGNDWGSQVLRMFRALGHNLVARAPPASQEPAALVEWLAAQQVPVSALLEELERRLRPEWTASELQCDPRSFPEGGRNGVKLCRYRHWMGLPEEGQAHAHLAAGTTRQHHIVFLRFRLLCWSIAINRPGGLPRAERRCPNCSHVEDEFHVLFECSHYADLKPKYFDDEQIQRFCDVSEGRAAAASIWSKLPPVALAEFLMDVLRWRGCVEEADEVVNDAELSGSESDWD